MNYRIILHCSNETDQNKFGRDLQMNDYASAEQTYKTLVGGALNEIIDPFTLDFYYGEKLRCQLVKL